MTTSPTRMTTRPASPEARAERMFRDAVRDMFRGSAALERFFDGTGMPTIEEYREDGAFVVRAELPGIDPDKDLTVTVNQGVLSLVGTREQHQEDERPDGYRSEFRYGRFERLIALPTGASESDVEANYRDGILEIRIPVASTPPSPAPVVVKHS